MNRKLTNNEALLQLASTYLGLQEVSGIDHNQVILDWFKDIGFEWVDDDETAWCSCAINWLAWKLGLERSGKLDARSWLKVGRDVTHPEPGDIVIFWRESLNSWKGHVGIFTGLSSRGYVFCMGGNQRNEFNIIPYAKTRVLGYRRLGKK